MSDGQHPTDCLVSSQDAKPTEIFGKNRFWTANRLRVCKVLGQPTEIGNFDMAEDERADNAFTKLVAADVRAASRAQAETAAAATAAAAASSKLTPNDADTADDESAENASTTTDTSAAEKSADNRDAASLVEVAPGDARRHDASGVGHPTDGDDNSATSNIVAGISVIDEANWKTT